MSAAVRAVLAADVGGTNTKFAIARVEAGKLGGIDRKVFPSRGFDSLELAIEAFLGEPEIAPHAQDVTAACFAVAGPVEGGRARLTNLPWQIDENALAQHFGIPRVNVLNDFAAAALGIEALAPGDFLTLQQGTTAERAARVVVGAGTGLGVGLLTWSGDGYCVHPSEGGHADFAPIDDLQQELLTHLRAQFGHVSLERIVSGSGLVRILDFLSQRRSAGAGRALLEAMTRGDPADAIARAALGHADDLAVRALDIFVSAYGAFAGNMALIALARGGVYIAGGIAPKIAEKLQDGAFMRAFTAKGRFGALLQTIPVHVVLNEHVGLLGALVQAARMSS